MEVVSAELCASPSGVGHMQPALPCTCAWRRLRGVCCAVCLRLRSSAPLCAPGGQACTQWCMDGMPAMHPTLNALRLCTADRALRVPVHQPRVQPSVLLPQQAVAGALRCEWTQPHSTWCSMNTHTHTHTHTHKTRCWCIVSTHTHTSSTVVQHCEHTSSAVPVRLSQTVCVVSTALCVPWMSQEGDGCGSILWVPEVGLHRGGLVTLRGKWWWLVLQHGGGWCYNMVAAGVTTRWFPGGGARGAPRRSLVSGARCKNLVSARGLPELAHTHTRTHTPSWWLACFRLLHA